MSNIFLTFNTNSLVEYNSSRYDTEKERKRLLDQARYDMRNTPGSAVWYVDVTTAGVQTGPVGEI